MMLNSNSFVEQKVLLLAMMMEYSMMKIMIVHSKENPSNSLMAKKIDCVGNLFVRDELQIQM